MGTGSYKSTGMDLWWVTLIQYLALIVFSLSLSFSLFLSLSPFNSFLAPLLPEKPCEKRRHLPVDFLQRREYP